MNVLLWIRYFWAIDLLFTFLLFTDAAHIIALGHESEINKLGNTN